MTKADKAGSYQLKHFVISDFMGRTRLVDNSKDVSDVDAKLLMGEWSVSESINSDTLSGSAQILDGVGLFYDFGLKGEEKLYVVYEDFFGQEREHTFFIHAVSNVKPAKPNSSDLLTYTIHFVSETKFIADTSLLRRSYHGLISDMVEACHSKYFGDSQITIEPTEGEQTLVVPAYTATETMNFFARHAYGGSSTFRFYENRDGYHFRTIEHMIDNQPTEPLLFHYNNVKDETPSGQLEKMNGIVDLNMGQPVDTLYDLYNGTYNKTAVELDYINRKATNTEYKYNESFPSSEENWGYGSTKLKPNHSEDFVEEYLSTTKRMLIVKDYPDSDRQNNPAMREKTYINELAPESWAINQQSKHNNIKIKIYGRNSITAGSVIEIAVEQFRPPLREIDVKYSGKYLVDSVANEFYGDVYMQVLSLSRRGTI